MRRACHHSPPVSRRSWLGVDLRAGGTQDQGAVMIIVGNIGKCHPTRVCDMRGEGLAGVRINDLGVGKGEEARRGEKGPDLRSARFGSSVPLELTSIDIHAIG
jgi:hypothetical protein